MSTPDRKVRIPSLQRRWSAIQVQRNQARLHAAARKGGKLLLQVTTPAGCGGNPNHYYHFIFDLLLPLYLLVEKAPPSAKFAVGGLGPFADEIQRIFPNRVSVYKARSAKRAHREGFVEKKLRGMNPRGVHITKARLRAFRDFMFAAKKVTPEAGKRVLLIERKPANRYYVERGKSTSGSGRRSILNHQDLCAALQGMERSRDTFMNLQLENLDLEKQMYLFSGADLVIAQHGASLANALWMAPGTHVVEISKHKSYNHFAVLCQILGLHHHSYLVEGDHVDIDTEDFMKWLGERGLDRQQAGLAM